MNMATTLNYASIETFQKFLLEKGKSHNTIRAYTTDVRSLLEFYNVDEIRVEDLDSLAGIWLNETRADAAPKTTARRMASIRSFAKIVCGSLILDDYGVPRAKKQVPHPIPEGIPGVLRMCLTARTNDESALFAMQGLLGLRVSEALSVSASNVNLHDMILTVRGKGDKERDVPISPVAWKFMEQAYNFSLCSGGKLVNLSDRGARLAVTSSGKRLEFTRNISSHDLRATLATDLLEKTNNIRLVQEVLGHSSVITTQLYTLVDLRKMRQGLEIVSEQA